MEANSTIYTTTHCQGLQNFSSNCTHNGPSKGVWTEIAIVGFIIFGLFGCYVRWSNRKKEFEWIQWNDSSSDVESTMNGYVHMHPDLNRRRRSSFRKRANSWLSKLSSSTLMVDLSSLNPLRQDGGVDPTTPTDDSRASNAQKGDDLKVVRAEGDSTDRSASELKPNSPRQ
jgi:hypothetical protein